MGNTRQISRSFNEVLVRKTSLMTNLANLKSAERETGSRIYLMILFCGKFTMRYK